MTDETHSLTCNGREPSSNATTAVLGVDVKPTQPNAAVAQAQENAADQLAFELDRVQAQRSVA